WDNLSRARTMAFCVLTYGQLFLSFGFRSQRHTMPEVGALANPHLLGAIAVSVLLQLSVVMLPFAQPIFDTARHLHAEWWLLAGLSLAPVTVVELAKIGRSALRRSRAGQASRSPMPRAP
ncbi:MAG TPA: cation-translocating P-type ATPase C-terminal domain-containing protein, partial [Polyangia bacterium]|nr:cation-translocating P-type ATPase C-terminal domain-containing protein [Polyangia bacterium]